MKNNKYLVTIKPSFWQAYCSHWVNLNNEAKKAIYSEVYAKIDEFLNTESKAVQSFMQDGSISIQAIEPLPKLKIIRSAGMAIKY